MDTLFFSTFFWKHTGGNYSTSEKCQIITKNAREAMSDFLNCNSNEIIFGHNTTTLVYHLAHSVCFSLS